MLDQLTKRAQRTKTALPVLYGDPITNRQGTIVDISDTGACINGEPPAIGKRIHIDYGTERTWGTVRWSEHDRFGVEFDTGHTQALSDIQAAARRKAFQEGARLLGVGGIANDNAARVFGRKSAI